MLPQDSVEELIIVSLENTPSNKKKGIKVDRHTVEAEKDDTIKWQIAKGQSFEFAVYFSDKRSPFKWFVQDSKNGMISDTILYNPDTNGAQKFSYTIIVKEAGQPTLVLDPDIQVPKPGHRS